MILHIQFIIHNFHYELFFKGKNVIVTIKSLFDVIVYLIKIIYHSNLNRYYLQLFFCNNKGSLYIFLYLGNCQQGVFTRIIEKIYFKIKIQNKNY